MNRLNTLLTAGLSAMAVGAGGGCAESAENINPTMCYEDLSAGDNGKSDHSLFINTTPSSEHELLEDTDGSNYVAGTFDITDGDAVKLEDISDVIREDVVGVLLDMGNGNVFPIELEVSSDPSNVSESDSSFVAYSPTSGFVPGDRTFAERFMNTDCNAFYTDPNGNLPNPFHAKVDVDGEIVSVYEAE